MFDTINLKIKVKFNMTHHIPRLLLYSRLAFAIFILLITIAGAVQNNGLVICLLYIGLLSDIFYGIIARKLGISTQNFRVQDTIIDLLFYLSVFGYIIASNFEIIYSSLLLIYIVLSLELLMYVISLIRFRKLPSPHAILSKFWGIYIIIEFTLLLLNIEGDHFSIALFLGVFVHLDRVLIYSILKTWEHDIPSCYHALLLRNGEEIKRNKIFNG